MFVSALQREQPKGTLLISTINRTVLSRLLAIELAENVFRWVAQGTHSHDKFVKPEDLHEMFKTHGLTPTQTSGLSLNPVKNKWSLTSSTAVNYITAATKNP